MRHALALALIAVLFFFLPATGSNRAAGSIRGRKVLTKGVATSLCTFDVPNNSASGCMVYYTVEQVDGSSTGSLTKVATINATNQAGTVTTNVGSTGNGSGGSAFTSSTVDTSVSGTTVTVRFTFDSALSSPTITAFYVIRGVANTRVVPS